MKFHIIEYNDISANHMCRDENGDVVFIDLFVSGDIDGSYTNTSIVGMDVEIERLDPMQYCACGKVEVINDKESS